MQKKDQDSIGTGRRKRAVASVRVRKGTGKVIVNKKDFASYFPLEMQRTAIMDPMTRFLAEVKNYDVVVRVKGGGISAQSNAVRLGISRALVQMDENLRKDLKDLGYLTRDPRRKERKKYGLAGARARYQHSKR